MDIVKFIADWLMIPIGLLALYGLVWRVSSGRRYDVYVRVLLAGLTAYVGAKIIGLMYQPAQLRPFELLGVDPGAAYLDNPGFPSDHVLFAVFLVLAVWYGTRLRWLTLVLVVLTAFVALGRVLALVHAPLDVVGGAVIACLGVVWYVNWTKIRQLSSKKRKNIVQ